MKKWINLNAAGKSFRIIWMSFSLFFLYVLFFADVVEHTPVVEQIIDVKISSEIGPRRKSDGLYKITVQTNLPPKAEMWFYLSNYNGALIDHEVSVPIQADGSVVFLTSMGRINFTDDKKNARRLKIGSAILGLSLGMEAAKEIKLIGDLVECLTETTCTATLEKHFTVRSDGFKPLSKLIYEQNMKEVAIEF